MTTRAEEIAAEGPYSKFGDPKIGRWYVLCDPDPYVWELDERQIDARVIALNAAFIKGYKQGQQDRWISVEERLPEYGEVVDIWTMHSKRIADAKFADGQFWQYIGVMQYVGVTHWMPLPAPPQTHDPK